MTFAKNALCAQTSATVDWWTGKNLFVGLATVKLFLWDFLQEKGVRKGSWRRCWGGGEQYEESKPRTRCRHIVEEEMTGDLLFRISADMFWSRFTCEIAIWRRLQGSLFLHLSPGTFYCTREHWCEKGKLTLIVLSCLILCAVARFDFNATLKRTPKLEAMTVCETLDDFLNCELCAMVQAPLAT